MALGDWTPSSLSSSLSHWVTVDARRRIGLEWYGQVSPRVQTHKDHHKLLLKPSQAPTPLRERPSVAPPPQPASLPPLLSLSHQVNPVQVSQPSLVPGVWCGKSIPGLSCHG